MWPLLAIDTKSSFTYTSIQNLGKSFTVLKSFDKYKMLESFNYIFLGTYFIRGHNMGSSSTPCASSFEWNDHMLHHWLVRTFFLVVEIYFGDDTHDFQWSCSRILQNNSLWRSIRAAWHWRIRWNALLVCVERVNFSELEIFILSQVIIHSASACRNWVFFITRYTTAFPSQWDELNLFLQFETVHKM